MPRLPGTSPQTLSVLEVLLAEREQWHYGYDLSRRTGLRSGTLYPLLMRLAERGWLETRWGAPERAGRPPRHLYRLTGEGVRETAMLAQAKRPAIARLQPGESAA